MSIADLLKALQDGVAVCAESNGRSDTDMAAAFAHYLLNVKVVAKYFDSRLGCRAWLNPEIAAMLYDDSPAGRLLELIDLAVFDDDESKGKAWEGGADELEEVLVSPASPIEREASRFCNHNNVARLLGRLAEDMPERVTKHRTNARRLWKITPPPVETVEREKQRNISRRDQYDTNADQFGWAADNLRQAGLSKLLHAISHAEKPMKTHTPPPPSESGTEPRSLTYQQASARLGISPVTLRRWRAEGRFKVRVFSSTLVRIPIDEIERMEKEALV